MKNITILETPEEFIKEFRKHTLGNIKITNFPKNANIDIECENESFDLREISFYEFIKVICKDYNVNLDIEFERSSEIY